MMIDILLVDSNASAKAGPKLICIEIVRKHLAVYGMNDAMVSDRAKWRSMIHITSPKLFGIRLGYCCTNRSF